MYALNFKKEWRMNRSLLISFFAVLLLLFIGNTTFYLILKNINLADNIYNVLTGVWAIIFTLSSLLKQILAIVLMFWVLKNDLGKNKIHYTIFTPQSLFSWFLPKLVFVFLIQGFFALLDFGYMWFVSDIGLVSFPFDINIILLLTSTFNFGFFMLLTLSMAIFYSFRNRSLGWSLITVSVLLYFIAANFYTVYQSIRMQFYGETFGQKSTLLITFFIKNSLGLVYAYFAYRLFDKKIEY